MSRLGKGYLMYMLRQHEDIAPRRCALRLHKQVMPKYGDWDQEWVMCLTHDTRIRGSMGCTLQAKVSRRRISRNAVHILVIRLRQRRWIRHVLQRMHLTRLVTFWRRGRRRQQMRRADSQFRGCIHGGTLYFRWWWSTPQTWHACTMQSHANVALTEKIASQVCTFRENTSQAWYACKRQSHTNVALTEKIASLICVCREIE